MNRLKELQQKLDTERAEARRLNDEAEARAKEAGREDISDEDRGAIDKALDSMRTLQKRIEDEERKREIERAEAAAELSDGDGESNRQTTDTTETPEQRTDGDAERRYEMFLRAPGLYDKNVPNSERDAFMEEARALQADSDIHGGYALMPKRMVPGLIKAVDDPFIFRQLATDVGPFDDAASLGAMSLDNDPADADWTAEVGTVQADSTMTLGAREMTSHDLTKKILVSRKLLRKAPRIGPLVNDRLAYKVRVPRENAYMTGSGAGRPLGIFTASAQGISTNRDVNTSNSTTAPTFDNMKTVVSTLKQQYHGRARWIMHRDTWLKYELIKDGDGNYIVGGGDVTRGIPMSLRGFPVILSEYAPNTFTTGLYVAVFGDPSFYWYADDSAVAIQRLDELHSATRQVGFQIEWGGDGMPVLEEAFVRVTLA